MVCATWNAAMLEINCLAHFTGASNGRAWKSLQTEWGRCHMVCSVRPTKAPV